MPDGYSDIYAPTRLVQIQLKGFTTVRYAFRTKIKEASSTALGHEDALTQQGNLKAGAVIGANSPKPPRATRITTGDGYESSFVSSTKVGEVRKSDEWTVVAGRVRRPKTSKRSKQLFVKVKAGQGSYNYAWVAPMAQFEKFKDQLTNLGIEEVKDSNYATVLYGVNKPKPQKASKEGTGRTISVFVSDSKLDSLPQGWSTGSGNSSEPFGLD